MHHVSLNMQNTIYRFYGHFMGQVELASCQVDS